MCSGQPDVGAVQLLLCPNMQHMYGVNGPQYQVYSPKSNSHLHVEVNRSLSAVPARPISPSLLHDFTAKIGSFPAELNVKEVGVSDLTHRIPCEIAYGETLICQRRLFPPFDWG